MISDNTTRSEHTSLADGQDGVLRLRQVQRNTVERLLLQLGLRLELVKDAQPIPGSYWGDEEAGLIGNRLLARGDTPLHSILHEACHYLCMDPPRRETLHRDAGGDYDEENAVCYLQIVLSSFIPEMGRNRMFSDMDRWGYSFRLGSACSWFEQDAGDALGWLRKRGLLTIDNRPAMLALAGDPR